MDYTKQQELTKLTNQYFQIASAHIDRNAELNEQLRRALLNRPQIYDRAELPGFESKQMKFGRFENREFVAMMTDIRKSTDIINSPNGLVYIPEHVDHRSGAS